MFSILDYMMCTLNNMTYVLFTSSTNVIWACAKKQDLLNMLQSELCLSIIMFYSHFTITCSEFAAILCVLDNPRLS